MKKAVAYCISGTSNAAANTLIFDVSNDGDLCSFGLKIAERRLEESEKDRTFELTGNSYIDDYPERNEVELTEDDVKKLKFIGHVKKAKKKLKYVRDRFEKFDKKIDTVDRDALKTLKKELAKAVKSGDGTRAMELMQEWMNDAGEEIEWRIVTTVDVCDENPVSKVLYEF